MASTGARQSARARARAAQQAVIVERKRRDEQNMASLTDYFTAAEQIDAARLAMAEALEDIRRREGSLAAAATLVGIGTGEARKLLALLAAQDSADVLDPDDPSLHDSSRVGVSEEPPSVTSTSAAQHE